MSKFSRSWMLVKQSFAVLAADKRLVLFPVLSAVAAIVVSLSFAIPLFTSGAATAFQNGQATPTEYVVLFLFYFANYFVVVYFNCALVACASICLSGGHATLADGLRAANQRLGRILMWAAVAATVGLLLRMLEERAQKLGKIVVWLLGTTWTLITYFIVPVLVFEDLDVIESVKRSAHLLKQTWGEEFVAGFSFGLIWLVALLPGIALAAAGFMVHPLLGAAVLVVYGVVLAAVAAAVKSIFTVALYRYAAQQQVPPGFSPELVQGAFGGSKAWAAGAGQ